MQGSRFDAFTRWTARRSTRRTAVTQAGAGVAAAFGLARLGSRPVMAQVANPVTEASPAAAVPVSLLYVQYAGPTTLTPGSGDVHTLTMTGVRPQTLYFSDRPNRIAGAEPTAAFVDGFAQAFADSAPNASLIGHFERGGHQEEAVVLTLRSATYDAAASTLTYEVTLLDAERITDVAFEQEPLTVLDTTHTYAEASLLIDNNNFPPGTEFKLICFDGTIVAPGTDCCPVACEMNEGVAMEPGIPRRPEPSCDDTVEGSWECTCTAT
jgi:hypothetical protein